MKKLLVLAVLFVLGACALNTIKPVVITIEAQSLPITKTVAWDDSDTSITNYTVTLDGTVVGNPTAKSQQVTFTTQGPHTITISATNLWGSSAATPLSVVVALPANPANIRIQ